MTASIKTNHNHSWVSRLIVSLTIGLMMLALGAATAFAGTGSQATQVARNDAPVSTGGGVVTLNEDDDEDEDDEEEGGGGSGGGLPATDTAPFSVISTGGGVVTLNEDDDEDDEDEDDEEEGGGGSGGGLPATDTSPLAASDTSSLIPAVALLVIAGLAGGAVTVAAKRSIRP